MSATQKPSIDREQLLARFRATVRETIAKASTPHNGKNTASFALRHFIHPHGYELAFDYMRIYAEETGDTLDERGVCEFGAYGELWLPKALALRAEAMKADVESSAAN
ncbi:hypothetical protein [Corallococcus exiguus]|uniref:hypothetical protein n=1 Tax=Corallococcus exiguus TaxID=83462 RepID=UPI0014724B42|nr:hypothetical protein [Corallococcus exiguus]NNB89931.1 hypothetical protein [Corallococcus exiguus]